MYVELFRKSILVVGCGNPLLGDDGFGPAVIEHLETRYELPDHVGLFDAGTSARELLFDLLFSNHAPDHLILVDAVRHSKISPGSIMRIDIDQIPENKVADYSLHQFPATNILKELNAATLIDIQIYVAQIDHIPQRVATGLSAPVETAVDKMGEFIKQKWLDPGCQINGEVVLSC